MIKANLNMNSTYLMFSSFSKIHKSMLTLSGNLDPCISAPVPI